MPSGPDGIRSLVALHDPKDVLTPGEKRSSAPPPARSGEPAAGPPLQRALGPVMLWGLGVGYVISGEYFGWNLGLPRAGTYGLLLAFGLITVLYITFVFSYAELACAIPRAGGAFVYGLRGLGRWGGTLGGVAQAVEFIFAPAAIALAIGEYMSIWLPGENKQAIAILAYLVFTGINIWGVKQAAAFELAITVLAVGELLVFCGVTAPHFRWEQFSHNPWPNGWAGALAAIPFAIWFYLAIEGVANVAEEARDPQRDVAIGFTASIATLVVLAALVLFCAVGVGGWESIVYEPGAITRDAAGLALPVDPLTTTSDKPLPLALGQVVRPGHFLYHLLVGVGLIGLVASFHGIILAAGRALFEMGRAGFLPPAIGIAGQRTRTPANALLLNGALGMAAILVLGTGTLITLSALGAVSLYIVSMLSLLALRRREPDLPRPFRMPLYPFFPLTALCIAVLALSIIAWEEPWLAGSYAAINVLALFRRAG